MCRYCVEYGKGTKWYLNPDNYRADLFQAPGHNTSFDMLSGTYKNNFEVGAAADSEANLPDYNFGGAFNIALENITQHQGQVVPLEDALKIIDLAYGDRFILMHCACRRYFGHKDVYSCLFFDPVVDRVLGQRPWETDSRVISREEAREFETEMDSLGLVHSIWDAGVDTDGKPPIVMCHCLETDCMPTRIRAHFGIINAQRKGEYVAVIDRKQCAEGCTKMPVCLPRCPFGAMRYSPLDQVASVNISRCFGCGLCRSACPTSAIKLVDRITYPALVDVW
jgi:Pyruvate/2-oxoacid:ferredoxin oxidoreductase delta subunit